MTIVKIIIERILNKINKNNNADYKDHGTYIVHQKSESAKLAPNSESIFFIILIS